MRIPYFAYGANLDREAMAKRCPGATVSGRASLADHRVVSMREGWLSITPSPGDRTEGLLWELDREHLLALDAYEEVDKGIYVHATLRVEREDDSPIEALVYIGTNDGPGRLNAEYAVRVARAARRELGASAASLIEGLAEA